LGNRIRNVSFFIEIFFRFFWKIVDNGDGRAVAFIGDNFPGTVISSFENDMKTKIAMACSDYITFIFKNGNSNSGFNYIRSDPYQSKNGDLYGEIRACDLNNVQIPEMILVRDYFMNLVPYAKWDLLKTPVR